MPPAETATLAELLWSPNTYWFWTGVAFLYGLFIGSFLNVAIYRLPMGLSVNKPKRSFCYRCGTTIRWQDNIPVLSYFLLGGKCHSCGVKYGWRYALIEVVTAVIFAAVFLGANPQGSAAFNFATIWYLAFASLLIVGTMTDLDHWIIPDEVTIWGAGAAILAAVGIGFLDAEPLLALFGPLPALRLSQGQDFFNIFVDVMLGPDRIGAGRYTMLWWEPVANAIIGAAFGSGMLYGIGVIGKLALGKEAMGFGDVKLFAMIGATLGITGCLVTLMLASFVGLLNTGVLSLTKFFAAGLNSPLARVKEDLGQGVPKDDLAARTVALFASLPKPKPSSHLPFGPAISIAALLVLIFQFQIRHAIGVWLSL